MNLRGRIAELHGQIASFSWQSERELGTIQVQCQHNEVPEFHQFDAFSFPLKPLRNQRLTHWQSQPPTSLEALQLPPSQQLPEFEDLLVLP